jgi:hypothetical protein
MSGLLLSFNRKSVTATWAHHSVHTLCTGQTKSCLASGALAVHVRFSVLEFVFLKLEIATEFFVFSTALGYIS